VVRGAHLEEETMLDEARREEARRLGVENARRLREERARLLEELERDSVAALGARAGAARPGLLVAEGDSWFSYPFFDVLEALERVHRWDVESVAHAGDTMESMAYDRRQLAGLARRLAKLHAAGRRPDAILLSAGGNDVAGPALSALLNYRGAPSPGPSDAIAAGLIGERLGLALVTLLGMITEMHRLEFDDVPRILVHGYDYPVPDGRGYAGGFWVLPGPWLEPQFRARGYDSLAECVAYMRTVIDRFNEAVRSAAAGYVHVTYVDLRGALSAELEDGRYRARWANELHPTVAGFKALAARFDAALRR
jgi:lysophospholipase L1-like esterase